MRARGIQTTTTPPRHKHRRNGPPTRKRTGMSYPTLSAPTHAANKLCAGLSTVQHNLGSTTTYRPAVFPNEYPHTRSNVTAGAVTAPGSLVTHVSDGNCYTANTALAKYLRQDQWATSDSANFTPPQNDIIKRR